MQGVAAVFWLWAIGVPTRVPPPGGRELGRITLRGFSKRPDTVDPGRKLVSQPQVVTSLYLLGLEKVKGTHVSKGGGVQGLCLVMSRASVMGRLSPPLLRRPGLMDARCGQ